MAIMLHAPVRTLEQVRALAASGSSRFAREAQAELRERMVASLTKAVGEGRSA